MGSRLRTSGCGDSKPTLGMNFISEACKTLEVFGRGSCAPNICWSVLNASGWEAQQGSNSGSIPNNYGNLFPFLNFFSKFLTCKMALTLALLSSQGSCKAQIRCDSLCIEKHEAPYMVIEHPQNGLPWVLCANICQIFIQIQGTIHRPHTRGAKLASGRDNTRNRWSQEIWNNWDVFKREKQEKNNSQVKIKDPRVNKTYLCRNHGHEGIWALQRGSPGAPVEILVPGPWTSLGSILWPVAALPIITVLSLCFLLLPPGNVLQLN